MSVQDEFYTFTKVKRDIKQIKAFALTHHSLSVRQAGKEIVLVKVKDQPWMTIEDWRTSYLQRQAKLMNDLVLRLSKIIPPEVLSRTLPGDVKDYMIQVALGSSVSPIIQICDMIAKGERDEEKAVTLAGQIVDVVVDH